MAKKKINIVKASGETVEFYPEKLKQSLSKSGAAENAIAEILKTVQNKLYDGITTKEIYKMAFSLLKKNAGHFAARYKLKRAIMELGPSGFPFERFVAAILKSQGYRTQVGVTIDGHCVKHEIDVIAEKGDKHFMVECKFHNKRGYTCNVKIPLYIQSRFLDVKEQWQKLPDHATKFHQGWVVTNTRFTTDAIQFGNCAGLHLLGWNHPSENSLKEMVDKSGLHPITCLTTLTKNEKQKLLDKNIVLCMDLCDNEKHLLNIGIKAERTKRIMTEARQLCNKF